MDKIKGCISKLKSGWLNYDYRIRRILIIALCFAAVLGIMGSMGWLNGIPTWFNMTDW